MSKCPERQRSNGLRRKPRWIPFALPIVFLVVSVFATPPVKVIIESVPKGIDVTVAGQSCTTPCQINVPKNVIDDMKFPKFTDRNGKIYPVTKIGRLIWMAQNLDYAMEGSYCYDDNPGNCTKYGRLYTWDAAMKACPKGWHLPASREWDELEKEIGEKAGTKLKSEKWDGIDAFGFNALPAGLRSNYGDFDYMGSSAFFWTAAEGDGSYAYSRPLGSADSRMFAYVFDKDFAFSVRCAKDSQ